MDVLITLLTVYSALLFINFIFALQLWFTYRKALYLSLVGVWGFTLANFSFQQLTLNSQPGSIIAFSSYIMTAYCLCKILSIISEMDFSFQKYFYIYAGGLVISICLNLAGYNFTISALPAAIAVALPQIFIGAKKLISYRKSGVDLSNLFAVTLFINGVHFLDYPFLRPHFEFAVLGYSLVIAFSMIFAALIPCIVSRFESEKAAQVLSKEVARHKETADKLSEALTSAEKLTRLKSNFLANMSHEIRTPLNGVLGFSELLRFTTLTEKQREYCDHMDVSGKSLLEIINSVMSLAQLESGMIPVNNEIFDFENSVKEIIHHYMKSKNSNGIEVKSVYLNQVPNPVISDEGKIKQVLFNLINNAVKYSKSEDIIIEVSFIEKDKVLRVDVVDNGVGIEEGQIQKIFKRYEQNNQKQVNGGAGLGLSITRELMKILGGNIEITSKLNIGTRVICHIPVQLEESSNFIIPEKLRYSAGKEMKTTGKGPILIVEDNKLNQLFITETLKTKNLEFKLAADGKTAMEYYKKYTPCLIIMDIQLPDTSGLFLTEDIRKNDPETPIIICSAFAFTEDQAKSLKAGANEFLKKPFKMAELEEAIQRYL